MAKIGKNVIENLTTAMYEDLRIIYREYIQNSADSIDKAIRMGEIEPEDARIEVEINKEKRYIEIRDNGIGIPSQDFERIMGSIADSTKDRAEDKGFRGIGRLGGISACKTLVFSCSAKGESVKSICTWNAEQVRDILVDKKKNPSAEELVDMVTVYEIEPCDEYVHFFSVELIDVEKNASEILDEKSIKQYLYAVAPIPYEVGFKMWQNKIHEFATANGFRIDEYQIFVNGDRLFKPYTRRMYELCEGSKHAYDELIDIAFEIFKDNQGNVLAWMWYGISKFKKQIPVINLMRGIRLRKGNIQIGDENTFLTHGFYKEPRGCLYFVGEVFAVHSDLIPNARRDYFNLNDTCREFEDKIRSLFYDRFYTIYHHSNDFKNALKKQLEFQQVQNEFDDKVQNGRFIDAADKASIEKKLEEKQVAARNAAKKLETLSEKEGNDEVFSKVYKALRKEYAPEQSETDESTTTSAAKGKEKDEKNNTEKTNKTKNKAYMTQKLSQYSRKEQKLISRIYAILQAVLPHDTATIVISKIQEELSK